MEIIGIIAEYNPFHNGHIYHLEQIREKYSNAILILCLNGYFTQRGTISTLSKEDKTKISLSYGVDIVLELPILFGTQASDIFAYQSISILNHFFVNKIIFGSESNSPSTLFKIASIQLEDKEYPYRVQKYLKEGLNYPTAMAKALQLENTINEPNDLLGISYCKAIKQLNASIEVETIKRTNSYHDTKSMDSIISASNIRMKFCKQENITPYLPKIALESMKKENISLYFTLLKYKILTTKDLSIFLDVDEGIEYRIKKYIFEASFYEEFIGLIKTKRYTYNKLNRMFLHILLGITKNENASASLEYIKILGFSKIGRKYLHDIKDKVQIPLTPTPNTIQYHYEMLSAQLYEMLTLSSILSFDKKNKPINK